jgi:hypothetical protein
MTIQSGLQFDKSNNFWHYDQIVVIMHGITEGKRTGDYYHISHLLMWTVCMLYALRHEDVLGTGSTAPLFLTFATDGGEWSASCICHSTLRETAPSTHWIGGWVGPSRSGCCGVEKHFLFLLGIERQLSSPKPVAIPNESSWLFLLWQKLYFLNIIKYEYHSINKSKVYAWIVHEDLNIIQNFCAPGRCSTHFHKRKMQCNQCRYFSIKTIIKSYVRSSLPMKKRTKHISILTKVCMVPLNPLGQILEQCFIRKLIFNLPNPPVHCIIRFYDAEPIMYFSWKQTLAAFENYLPTMSVNPQISHIWSTGKNLQNTILKKLTCILSTTCLNN